MSIPDPHAIPESEHDAHEYLTEADHAWDGGDPDRAYELYHSFGMSHFAPQHDKDRVFFRLGLIAQTRGDNDLALHHFESSGDPDAHAAAQALRNATHDDRTPTADEIPQTVEEFQAWGLAASRAYYAHDLDLAGGLFLAAAQCTAVSPGSQAGAAGSYATIAHEQGHDDEARQWLEFAMPNLSDDDPHLIGNARALLKTLGGAHVDAEDDSAASTQVAAGIQAYESGDAHGARVALEAALHLEGPDEQKGRARYYLGAMDYQAHKYADARVHIEAAVQAAAEPERSWAEAALHWRWDEDPAAAP